MAIRLMLLLLLHKKWSSSFDGSSICYEKIARKVARSEDGGLAQIVPPVVHVEFINHGSAAHTSRDPKHDAREEGLLPRFFILFERC